MRRHLKSGKLQTINVHQKKSNRPQAHNLAEGQPTPQALPASPAPPARKNLSQTKYPHTQYLQATWAASATICR